MRYGNFHNVRHTATDDFEVKNHNYCFGIHCHYTNLTFCVSLSLIILGVCARRRVTGSHSNLHTKTSASTAVGRNIRVLTNTGRHTTKKLQIKEAIEVAIQIKSFLAS